MENTNTDARKAAIDLIITNLPIIKDERLVYAHFEDVADLMVRFAQSRPDTLEKSVLEQAKINAVNNYIDGFKNISSFDKNSIAVDFCNGWDALLKRFDESLSEQPEAKPTEPESKLSPDLAYNSEANVSQNAECEKAIPIQKIIDLVNSYWRFNNFQEPISTWHEKQDFLKEIEKLQPEPEQVEKIYSEEFLTWRGKWFVKDNMVYPWKNKQGVRYSDEDLHKSFEQAMRESPFKPSTH